MDDEINLLPYILHCITRWQLFVFSIIVSLVLALILNFILPKEYISSTSFLMPKSTKNMNVGTGLLASFGYSGFSGSGESGIYSSYIMPIFKSNRIKKHVALKLKKNSLFTSNKKFNKLKSKEKIGFIIGELKFSEKVVLEQKEGLFVIQFANKNPKIILPVLNAYLSAIIQLNDELNIDSDVLQIIPLDEAIEPKSPYFPNLTKLILLLTAVGVFITFIFLILEKFIQLSKQK